MMNRSNHQPRRGCIICAGLNPSVSISDKFEIEYEEKYLFEFFN